MNDSLDIGRVLTRGFQTIANQFAVLATLSILLAGIPAVIMGLFVARAADPAQAFAVIMSPWFWLTFLITILFSFVLQAALVRASILDLRSEPVEIGPILLEALSLLLPVIGVALVTGIAVMFGMILLIVPGIMLLCMWIVAVPVLVGERRGVFGSLERSAELTKGSRWWVFLLLVIYLVAGGIISGVTGRLTGLTGGPSSVPTLIVSMIVSSVTGMVAAVMVASLYIELRALKEGDAGDLSEIFA
jgi:hypothetical protein